MKRTFSQSFSDIDRQFCESRDSLADTAYRMYQCYDLTGEKEKLLLWLTRAVALGHGIAAFKLGKMNYKGEHVPKDEEKAKKLFYMSAEKGNPAGQCLVALYEHKTNLPKAMEWIEKARLQGYSGVQKALDMMGST